METKLTAVQWLLENLNFEPYDEEEFISNSKMWEQAKAMEKEQIKDAFFDGDNWGKDYFSEEYYNETYGKDN